MIRTVVLAIAACSASPHVVKPPTSAYGVMADAVHPIGSEDVTITVGTRRIPGTIVAPRDPGTWPAIVLLVGSGPTDRDWNSPLLATKNGSGKLLAEELASRGALVLRFDKAGAGKNPGPPLAEFTIDTYRQEALAAIALVRARQDVRADHVFIAGHSEGGMHATRAALSVTPPLAGVIYLSSASRTMADTMLTQLEGNLTNPMAGLDDARVKSEMTSLRSAFADFLAARPVDPTTASTIPQLQQLVAGMLNPATLSLMRGLLGFDNAAEAAKLTVPVFIVNGAKDVQVDPELDARLLDRSLRAAKRDVTLYLAPDADHVLKHEAKSLAVLRADLVSVQNNYNAETRTLDEDAVTALVAWLAARTRIN